MGHGSSGAGGFGIREFGLPGVVREWILLSNKSSPPDVNPAEDEKEYPIVGVIGTIPPGVGGVGVWGTRGLTSLRLVALPELKKPPGPGVTGEVASISGVDNLFKPFKLEEELICLRLGKFILLPAKRAGEPERGVVASLDKPEKVGGIKLRPAFSFPGSGDGGKGLTVPLVLRGTGGGGSCVTGGGTGDDAGG